MPPITPTHFTGSAQARFRRHRLREFTMLAALSAAFLFVGAIALGLLV
jgi:hypothetical protein